ncbi:nuclear transport factor 2 family protein [Robiginitalea biformata]|nr:nuclear transport factor 2 family protein [Robiginitalea biformata]
MKRFSLLFMCCLPLMVAGQQAEKKHLDSLLTAWHQAASDADFDAYFGLMAPGGVFIGTDASENWDREAFMEFSRPYFDQGKAWSFRAIERNIYLGPGGKTAWFDELLDTWMQLCRGSGTLVKTPEGWKIAHYVLSMTIPNEEVEGAVALKRERDSLVRARLTGDGQ